MQLTTWHALGASLVVHAAMLAPSWPTAPDATPAAGHEISVQLRSTGKVPAPMQAAPVRTASTARTAKKDNATQRRSPVSATPAVARESISEDDDSNIRDNDPTGNDSPPVTASAPVSLESLTVICPGRATPIYPAISRRLRETGSVLLRVELDETGNIVAARVERTSGFHRLDAAALAVIERWQCSAPQRAGLAVRATAIQSFDFALN